MSIHRVHCQEQDDGKGGLSLRGVAFMTVLAVFDGFGGSGEHLALLLLALQNTGQRGNRDGFDGFGGYGGCGGFGRDGYTPLKLNPPFPSSCQELGARSSLGAKFSRNAESYG